MLIGKIAIGAAAVGGVGLIGRKVKEHLRQKEFDAIADQYKHYVAPIDQEIENALREMRSLDFKDFPKRREA